MRARLLHIDPEHPDPEVLRRAGGIIRSGGLVAFPTETVYGLGGNAFDPDAARKIYAAKGRPSDNPLIIHIAAPESLGRIAANIPESAEKLARECWPGPLTLILEKKEEVPDETTGGLKTVAVRMPKNKTAALFIQAAGGFVAAPSANLSGRPSPTKASHVAGDLGDRIDMIIDGGDADIGLESTIVDCTVQPPAVLRPGYIGEARLAGILGRVQYDPAQMRAGDAEAPKAPGMKYRHYAPKGELAVVEGERGAVTEAIQRMAAEALKDGRKPAVICSDETLSAYAGLQAFTLGRSDDGEGIARCLFDTLRKTDEEGADVIFSERFDAEGIGDAVMNRLLKAAGNRVIKV